MEISGTAQKKRTKPKGAGHESTIGKKTPPTIWLRKPYPYMIRE
jgi:hypothetical protein